jgi:hypothetical protein
VRVYAGVDPVTKRRHDLIEIIRRAETPTGRLAQLATSL